jgi:hypothetical protein
VHRYVLVGGPRDGQTVETPVAVESLELAVDERYDAAAVWLLPDRRAVYRRRPGCSDLFDWVG